MVQPIGATYCGRVKLLLVLLRLLTSGVVFFVVIVAAAPAEILEQDGRGLLCQRGSCRAARLVKGKIMEINGLAAELFEAGRLDDETASLIDVSLLELAPHIDRIEEARLREGSGSVDEEVVHELRFMVAMLRGTLRQQLAKQHDSVLSDAQVEALGASTFSSAHAWDEYYKKVSLDVAYDWYGSWDSHVKIVSPAEQSNFVDVSTIGALVSAHLKSTDKILVLGCGRSGFSAQLYRAGFEHIVNVDISDALLLGMQSRLSPSMPKMRWLRMDASALVFDAGERFDAVLDKGTFDALEQNVSLSIAAMREAYRILEPGGVLVSITSSPAISDFLARLNNAAGWVSCASIAADVLPAGPAGPAVAPLADQIEMQLHVVACQREAVRASWISRMLALMQWPLQISEEVPTAAHGDL